jgi:CRP/FNR family cyclic AMP-dependent transcriptional regulator
MNQDENHASEFDSIIARIEGGKSELKYQRDQIIYSQGEPAEYVLYVRAGAVKVTVASEAGKDAVVAILQRGNFCGEDCLAGQKLRVATVTALIECVLTRLPKERIIRALRDDAEFSELFMTYLLERNIRMQEDLVDQLFNSTERRLALLLLILANYGKDWPEAIIPKITQETLADMIGTSRAHVNFFMNKFRQLGLIEYNGDIKVNRSLLNALLHEKPEIKS